MIIGKKKRDVKFIIYQSLYILVIAMLGAKHVTINDIPPPLPEDSQVINSDSLESMKAELDSLKSLSTYIPETQVVLDKLKNEDEKYIVIKENEVTIDSETLKKKDARISELERMKTPTRTPTSRPQETTPTPNIPGIRKK